jgi:hypothetical protein
MQGSPHPRCALPKRKIVSLVLVLAYPYADELGGCTWASFLDPCIFGSVQMVPI